MCVLALGVSLKGELCFWARISWSRLLVCWFKPTPCVDVKQREPELEIVFQSFSSHVWVDGWLIMDVYTVDVFNPHTVFFIFDHF